MKALISRLSMLIGGLTENMDEWILNLDLKSMG
jgi:hypothetical protein